MRTTKYCITIILGLFALLATGAENLNTWQKQMPITFSGYAPPGGEETLTNFPALVILSNTTAGIGFDYADFLSPPYGDLRFTAADKTTPLNFEVEKWDVSGNSYVWVQVPEFANNLIIHAFWGRSGVDAPPCTTNGAAWEKGFVGVWHMNQANVLDSTTNANNGVGKNGIITTNTGAAGNALWLNSAASNYVDFGTGLRMRTNNATLSIWFKTANSSPQAGIIGKPIAGDSERYSIFCTAQLYANFEPSSGHVLQGTPWESGYSDNRWHQLTAIYNRTGNLTLCVDGVQKGAVSISSAASFDMNRASLFLVGAYGNSAGTGPQADFYFPGSLDEGRLMKVAVSSNWIWAAYMNMASNAVFNDYGAPKYGGAPGIVNSNAIGGATYVTLNGYLTSTGMDANVSAAVFWGTNDAGQECGGWAYTNYFPGTAAIGPLSTNVVPTVPGAKHYYRFYATNSLGDTWADPAGRFTWLGAPTVNNAGGAINIISSRATLQGEVTGGNPSPNASIYWGTMDKGVNKTLWEHETPVGVVSNWTFSANVSLSPGLTYYYRCYASNTYGEAWASTTTNFTATIHSKTWNGAGANALASNPANWVGNIAPSAWDDIKLDATSSKNMTWDLNIPLSTWTQVGYLGTVTIATVYGPAGFTNLNIGGNCVISNGVWTHAANAAVEANRLRATIGGDLIVGTGAVIDVTGKGYGARGYDRGYGPGASDVRWYSASYGGIGSGGGPCYGSIIAPINLGSSGDGNNGGLPTGGGAVLLTVCGMVRNDGLVCANGGAVPAVQFAGSGGSIWLTSGSMSGVGAFRANGGYGTIPSAGGGGRIALVVTNVTPDFSGLTIQAIGGVGGSGGAGTVYLRGAAPDAGTLILDNANLSSIRRTDINSNVTDTAVGHVLIRNGAYLLLCANQTLTVGKIWSNSASFASQLGSMVIFEGNASSTSTVYGSNTFMGLICTNTGGKTIFFEAGKTNTIPAQGRLMLKGSETTTNLILRSTLDGSSWKLNVNALADQSVIYVDVKDSDALSNLGAEITAVNSRNNGGNFNWRFASVGIGETNTWTGNGSTVWSFSNNWSLARSPIDDDFVLIPSGRPRYPVLDNHRVVNGIELQSAASLSLAGYDLTVRKNATLAGAITASAMETITFQTNADFTGGAFTSARSTVLLTGSGNQSVNLGNQTFYKINVLNTNTVAFINGFTATELRCEALSGSRNLIFQQGAVFFLRDLVLLGSVASTNIVLRSSVSGRKWNLAVSGPRWSVQGVNVMDSDASFGLPIPAITSKDSGNNTNWFFDASQSVWLGTSGTSFHLAANWLSGVVPDATTRVLVESANPMVISSPVKVRDLMVGGGTGAASVTVNAELTVIENITARTNSTLILNRSCVVKKGLYVLSGGALTHSANTATEANKLNVIVYGDMGVDMNGVVNVTGKGYGARAYDFGYGPGAGSCGSYGGLGGGGGQCYGSIVAPTNLGSAGRGINGYILLTGGGAILLKVSGVIRNDGLICADGAAAGSTLLAGSAGSIWLTSSALIGAGVIRANGGFNFDVGTGQSRGGGGRIALVVTNVGAGFSDYTGAISAYGFGAGTIYKRRTADRRSFGIVLLDNNGLSSGSYTDVPPGPPNVTNEVEFVAFNVTNAAMLRLTNDYLLGDIWLDSANARLDLGSKTLTVRSREHPLTSGGVLNYGQIIWWPYVPHGTIFRAK